MKQIKTKTAIQVNDKWMLTLICSTIFLICGSNPMSNILSASSNTRYVHLLNVVLPASKKSINLPGVAIQISEPKTNKNVKCLKQIKINKLQSNNNKIT